MRLIIPPHCCRKPCANTPYDILHKSLFGEALGELGRVETQAELVGEPLFGDVLFRARGTLEGADRERLGLLGRMAARRVCLFEPHSTNPRDEDLRSALRKLWIVLEGDDRGDDDDDDQPRLWVLSPGRPGALLGRFHCVRAAGWPAGVYRSAMEPRMAVVAIRELPCRRDTLLLRLMGRGTTFKRAVDDLLALAMDDPIRQLVLPVVLRWLRHLSETRNDARLRHLTHDEQETVMRAREWLENYDEQRRKEGHREGHREGRREELVRLFELRLDRPLSVNERKVVEVQLREHGHDRVARVVLDHDADSLAAWLAERGAGA